jgi:hypothetical protein
MVTINNALEATMEDILTVNEVIRELDIAQRGDGSKLLNDRYQPKNSKICRIWIANNMKKQSTTKHEKECSCL